MQRGGREKGGGEISTAGPSGRWSGQRDRRRAEFVDAALAAIARYGPLASTEQIAGIVGVTRTKLYRYFTDAADLQRAVARRASEMLIADLTPVWEPHGSLIEIVVAGITAYVRFLVGHLNLYHYLARCSLARSPEDLAAPDAIADIKQLVGSQLSQVFVIYNAAFRIQTDAELLAMAVVGLADSVAARWLDYPGSVSQEQLIADLVRWIWLLIDDTLRTAGIYLRADEPLPGPDEIARTAEVYRDPSRVRS